MPVRLSDIPDSTWAMAAAIAMVVLVLGAFAWRALTRRRKIDLPNAVLAPFARPSDLRQLPPDRRTPLGLVIEKPESALAAAYRDVLDLVERGPGAGRGGRIILVTGAYPGVGATTLAASLTAIAAASGRKTLIIDADLRRRGATRLLDIDHEPGIHEAAFGVSPLDRTIVHHDVYPFEIAPASESRLYGRELSASALWPNLLTEMRAKFDLVVIDAPPVFEGVETRMLTRMVDATLMAARLGRSSRFATAAATALAQNARSAPIVASVVIDGPPVKRRRRRRAA